MNTIIKISRFYNRKLFPKIEHLRGATFLSRQLSKLALKTANKEKNIEIDGLTLSNKIYDLDDKVARKVLTGLYEQDETKLIENLNPEVDVVELGGGIGYISCLINSRISQNNKHIVLEPNPEVIEIVRHNKDLNNASFEIQQKAYSHETKDVKLRIDDAAPFWGGSTYVERKESKTKEVQGVSLEEIVDNFELGDFTLVSDIEGGEFELLDEELDLISAKCSQAIIEFHTIEGSEIQHPIDKMKNEGFTQIFQSNRVYSFKK